MNAENESLLKIFILSLSGFAVSFALIMKVSKEALKGGVFYSLSTACRGALLSRRQSKP